jgi:NADH-quinone oxidoreductase subunit L
VLVYSLGYMKDDPAKGRFFASLALFEWAMLSFAYAPNLLQGFIFWELVGLASFLLIGFWYHKPSAVAAAKKAFIMTRIGDVGMFIGLIMLFAATGTLDIVTLTDRFAAPGLPAGLSPGAVELIAGLLFLGVMGKSAQFPLHTWLPDAMEGPTPVSALLHSATMVAAGVFLFARFHEVFLDAPTVMGAALVIGTITALIASTMAVVQSDLKKILAYSSISQLGFMIVGLAAGSLFAGLFHLTTHAIFKALLFLSAGAFIHHFGTNDVVAIGRGGGRKRIVATIGLVTGGLALAGVPILSGFWSKEAILSALHEPGYRIFLIAAYIAAFLTAYYTFRMIFLVVLPRADSGAVIVEPAHPHHGADHGEPRSMAGPILVLAALAAVAGLPWIGDALGDLIGKSDQVHHASLVEMILPIGIVFAGIGLAWLDFGAKRAPQRGILAWLPSAQRLFENGWYIDSLYQKTVVALTDTVARALHFTETRGFDGAGDGVAAGVMATGRGAARTHTGRLPIFIGTAVVVVAAFSLFLALG